MTSDKPPTQESRFWEWARFALVLAIVSFLFGCALWSAYCNAAHHGQRLWFVPALMGYAGVCTFWACARGVLSVRAGRRAALIAALYLTLGQIRAGSLLVPPALFELPAVSLWVWAIQAGAHGRRILAAAGAGLLWAAAVQLHPLAWFGPAAIIGGTLATFLARSPARGAWAQASAATACTLLVGLGMARIGFALPALGLQADGASRKVEAADSPEPAPSNLSSLDQYSRSGIASSSESPRRLKSAARWSRQIGDNGLAAAHNERRADVDAPGAEGHIAAEARSRESGGWAARWRDARAELPVIQLLVWMACLGAVAVLFRGPRGMFSRTFVAAMLGWAAISAAVAGFLDAGSANPWQVALPPLLWLAAIGLHELRAAYMEADDRSRFVLIIAAISLTVLLVRPAVHEYREQVARVRLECRGSPG